MTPRARIMLALIVGFAVLLSCSYAQDEASKEAWDSIHGRCAEVLRIAQAQETDNARTSTANAAERAQSTENGLPLQPFSYHEGFEGECPALTLWAKDGPATVNFSGPTEERAFSGNRSLKLDVTLEGGRYHYYGVPLRVPAEGKLTLSARIFVAEGTTARVGFGTNMVYPPTQHSGCGASDSYNAPTDAWHRIEVDLVARGRSGSASVMAGHTADTRGEEVGAYLDRWSLFIYGGEGKRAVVYLDDVRVEGYAPSEADYQAELARRWEGRQKRLRERIAVWREDIAKAREALESGPEPAGNVRDLADAVKASVAEAEGLIDDLSRRGYGAKDAFTLIDAALFIARFGPETIRTVSEGIAEGLPYVIYTPPAITDVHFATHTFPIPARVGTKLSCSACRGEYESVTAAVYALEDVEQMLVEAGELTGGGGRIPAASVEVHVVKSWYQAGPVISPNRKLLMPELLLKDAGLVRVDYEAEQNYLRSTSEDRTETYLLCSGPTSENLEGVRPVDADELQPVDIPARSLKQFWLTVRVPADAASGLYVGDVSFTTPAGSKTMPFEVTVHPFELLPSRLTYSIYYRAKLSGDGQPTIGSEYKSEKQYRAEIEDFLAHGVLYPTNYQAMDTRLLRRVLEIRKEAGLPADRFFNLGRQTGSPTSADQIAQLQSDVKQWIAFCRPFGYNEVYFYGIDEARGERLKAQRAAWAALREAGGKSFVACYKGTFEAVGDLLDCAVLASRPDPKEAEKWHSVGSEAFCYAYPQVGNATPGTYRRNFGLVLWKAGFDGAMDYAYQHGFNHVWNDFDSAHYCDHNFTYPTVDGVVGTIQWDGFREAVDDVRYVTTLERAIEDAPKAKSGLAHQARQWLDDLDPDTVDLYAAREQIAQFITRLK